MADKIQIRRGLASEATSNNPILSSGEVGLETDTGKFKIGDGVTAWTSLSYSNVLPSELASYALLATAQTFTASQRGTITTDNDLSFDLAVTNNFKCTPTVAGTLTFTNLTFGQSGNVLLDNTGGYVISAAAAIEKGATMLTDISTAGVYWLSYYTDGTSIYVTYSEALS